MKTARATKRDPTFTYEVASYPGAETIQRCFSCGTCTGACPVFQVDEQFNPRRLIRMILLGFREELLRSQLIWLCARCYACTAHCPQGVSFADITAVLRTLAIREGYAPVDFLDRVEEFGRRAAAFRKDCIRRACGLDGSDAEAILQKAKETVEKL